MADVLSLEMVPDAKGSEGMLTVDHYELIRRKVVIEGKSQRDVAKELGHSRETLAIIGHPTLKGGGGRNLLTASQ